MAFTYLGMQNFHDLPSSTSTTRTANTSPARIAMDDTDRPGGKSSEELSHGYSDVELSGFEHDGSINQGRRVAGRAIRSDRGQQCFDNSTRQEPSAFENTERTVQEHHDQQAQEATHRGRRKRTCREKEGLLSRRVRPLVNKETSMVSKRTLIYLVLNFLKPIDSNLDM